MITEVKVGDKFTGELLNLWTGGDFGINLYTTKWEIIKGYFDYEEIYEISSVNKLGTIVPSAYLLGESVHIDASERFVSFLNGQGWTRDEKPFDIANTKIFRDGADSIYIHDALYKLGVKEAMRQDNNAPYIYITAKKEIEYGYGSSTFKGYSHNEKKIMTPQQVLDASYLITNTKPKQKPKSAMKYKKLEVGMQIPVSKINEWANKGCNWTNSNIEALIKFTGNVVIDSFGDYRTIKSITKDVKGTPVVELVRDTGIISGYVRLEGFAEFIAGEEYKQATNLITNINTQSNEQIIVPRKKASIATGQRPQGTIVSGKASRATITVRPLINRAAVGY